MADLQAELEKCKASLQQECSARERVTAELAATKGNLDLATIALKQVLDIAAEEKSDLQRELEATRAELAALREDVAKKDRAELDASRGTSSTRASNTDDLSPAESVKVALCDKTGRLRWRDVLFGVFRSY
jgi:hypothetical protein